MFLLALAVKGSGPPSERSNPPKEGFLKEPPKELVLLNRLIEERNAEILQRVWLSSRPRLEELKRKNSELFRKELASRLDLFFYRIKEDNLPRFLDWVYSFGTDYLILLKDVSYLGDLVLCHLGEVEKCRLRPQSEEYIRSQIEKLLLPPESLEKFVQNEIKPLFEEYLREFQKGAVRILKDEYRKELYALLKKEATLSSRFPDGLIERVINEKVENFSLSLEGKLPPMRERALLSLAAGPLLKKLAIKQTAKVSAKIAVKLSEKITLKLSEKLFSKLANLGTAVPICVYGGPLMPACAAALGLISSLATDYLLTKADEIFNREQFAGEVGTELDLLKEKLVSTLVGRYLRSQNLLLEGMRKILKEDIPLRNLR